MSFGLRTWSSNGTAELDTDSFTYQVMHNQVYTLSFGQVLTVPITGFSTSTCVAAILPTTAASNNYAVSALPYVAVSAGSVTIRSKHPSEPGSEAGTVLQFRLLVMRYKN
jgi:hypothetical protein